MVILNLLLCVVQFMPWDNDSAYFNLQFIDRTSFSSFLGGVVIVSYWQFAPLPSKLPVNPR